MVSFLFKIIPVFCLFNNIKTIYNHSPTISCLDPEDYELPVLKQPLHFYPDSTKAPEVLHKLNEIVVNADAYLILTSVYNR